MPWYNASSRVVSFLAHVRKLEFWKRFRRRRTCVREIEQVFRRRHHKTRPNIKESGSTVVSSCFWCLSVSQKPIYLQPPYPHHKMTNDPNWTLPPALLSVGSAAWIYSCFLFWKSRQKRTISHQSLPLALSQSLFGLAGIWALFIPSWVHHPPCFVQREFH
jgi:hypothetical protein